MDLKKSFKICKTSPFELYIKLESFKGGKYVLVFPLPVNDVPPYLCGGGGAS